MLGLRLQILGQYHGLLRNFCDRSQSVSPLTMTYSSGVPGTGLMFRSGGGRGLCSVMTGAFSPLWGFWGGWAGCSSESGFGPGPSISSGFAAGCSCATAGNASDVATARSSSSASSPPRGLQAYQELPPRRRLRRVGVLPVELEENLFRLGAAAEQAQAASALEQRLGNGVACRIFNGDALEKLQRAGAIAAHLPYQARHVERVVRGGVVRMGRDEGEELDLGRLVLAVVQLPHRFGPGLIGIEGLGHRRVDLESSQRVLAGLAQLHAVLQPWGALDRVDVIDAAQAAAFADLHRAQGWPGLGLGGGRSGRLSLGLGSVRQRPGGQRCQLHFQPFDALLLLRHQRRLRQQLSAQLLDLLRLGRVPHLPAGARGESDERGEMAKAQRDSSERNACTMIYGGGRACQRNRPAGPSIVRR